MLARMSEYDPETRRHLDGVGTDHAIDVDGGGAGADDDDTEKALEPRENAVELVALQTELEEAGLLEPPPDRLLLAHEAATKHLQIVDLLQTLAESQPVEFDARSRELAYLSSVLIAGISVGGAALSPVEARSAALATCNLGLETLSSAGERIRIDREPGLVRLFLVGRSVLSTLPESVVEAFVRRLERLKKARAEPLHEWLVEQAEVSVADLREAVENADFEAAREAMLALCFVFEPRACRAIAPLLDELPRFGTTDSAGAVWIDSLASLSRAVALLRRISGKRGPR